MWDGLWNAILKGDLLLALFLLILNVIASVVNVILWPFGVLIATLIPSLDGMLTALSEYFDYAATYLAWIIDAFNIPGIVITAISSYYFFRFTTTFTVWTIKLLIKWKVALWG